MGHVKTGYAMSTDDLCNVVVSCLPVNRLKWSSVLQCFQILG